jgi:hypothetical protein
MFAVRPMKADRSRRPSRRTAGHAAYMREAQQFAGDVEERDGGGPSAFREVACESKAATISQVAESHGNGVEKSAPKVQLALFSGRPRESAL